MTFNTDFILGWVTGVAFYLICRGAFGLWFERKRLAARQRKPDDCCRTCRHTRSEHLWPGDDCMACAATVAFFERVPIMFTPEGKLSPMGKCSRFRESSSAAPAP